MKTLPTFETLPIRAILSGVVGGIFGVIAQGPVLTWAKVAVITALAHDIFILAADPCFKFSHHERIFFYGVTASIVGVIEIIVLRQLKLIDTLGTVLLASFRAWFLISILKNPYDHY